MKVSGLGGCFGSFLIRGQGSKWPAWHVLGWSNKMFALHVEFRIQLQLYAFFLYSKLYELRFVSRPG
ncbi:uncharacterized protein PHALS_07394 [Plasmopara halstedii]|uniref:Uncharacterized protein n=1 Tax=Plasmopara halstedii TaxID=4781 RepID=A0A0P1B6B6_PLAHL|nr:uncharacterized protein PHALS_07394 [Plasmopara halstedii]CEG49641.1 hypothetical protein PHALS_07394 [Plasmopara halstedii]|eukprot:XP_024586010.1 hypothetical protein PHALS_07394 [Plasmopara halstedii]